MWAIYASIKRQINIPCIPWFLLYKLTSVLILLQDVGVQTSNFNAPLEMNVSPYMICVMEFLNAKTKAMKTHQCAQVNIRNIHTYMYTLHSGHQNYEKIVFNLYLCSVSATTKSNPVPKIPKIIGNNSKTKKNGTIRRAGNRASLPKRPGDANRWGREGEKYRPGISSTSNNNVNQQQTGGAQGRTITTSIRFHWMLDNFT